MTYEIDRVFSYSIPSTNLEYIKYFNFNNSTIEFLPLTASNADESKPIVMSVSSDQPWVSASVVNVRVPGFPPTYTLTGQNDRLVVIPPTSESNILITVTAPPNAEDLIGTILSANLTFNISSGSGTDYNIYSTKRKQEFDETFLLNDRIAVTATGWLNRVYLYSAPDNDDNPNTNWQQRITYYDLNTVLGQYESYDPIENVIIFTRRQLLEKKRKVQLILENFTQPLCGYQSKYLQLFYGSCKFENTADAAGRDQDKLMVSNTWNFPQTDFPNINPNVRRNWAPQHVYIGGSAYGDTVKLLKQALRDALCVADGIDSSFAVGMNDSSNYFEFTDSDVDFYYGAQTFENVIKYCQDILESYLELINNVLAARGQSVLYGYQNQVTELTTNGSPESLYYSRKIGEPHENTITIPIRIDLKVLEVPLVSTIISTSREVLNEKTLTFFDPNREYKTLLNFGNDTQYVAEAWRVAPKDTESIQLKLTRPLATNVTTETSAFISREIAQSVIDRVLFELSPAQDRTPYLRPFNTNVGDYVQSKMLATNSSLSSLGLNVGSAGAVISGSTSYEDIVFRRWFTADFKSSELNVDFTNYNNFVHFGSAYKRLQAFNEKVKKIEKLSLEAATTNTYGTSVGSLLKAKEKEQIIRSFDPYEQFLYYAPDTTPYSASAYYVANELEYNQQGSWPKQTDGTIYSPTSSTAINWLSGQSIIAQRYDYNNPNYLILNLPSHIQEDENSEDYLTFFEMIGHLMDNIKIYIDQFPYIYSTQINPLKELSMDQVYEVARSFGLKLPNVYALENLQTFNAQFSNESGSRSYVAETWKRFLHSMVYFYKTKGSRTSFDALLNTHGISSPVIQLKETTYPVAGNYIQSDELTYGVRFDGSVDTNIKIPFVSSSINTKTLQLTFNPTLKRGSSILTGESWSIDINPHPSASKPEYGRLEIYSGSNRVQIATSSYFKLFSEDYTSLMLRSQSQDMTIIQTDGDQILFRESASINFTNLWNNTKHVYIGGSGSMKLVNFDGRVDEIRMWGETIADDDFVAQAYDPGSYYGSSYSSSYSSLYVHIPFSQPLPSITQSVVNESPYQNVSIIPRVSASGFTTESYVRITRGIKQYTPIVGSTIYTNKKVNIAPPPVFSVDFIDENGTRTLSRIESIKKIEEKQYNSGQNIVSFAVSPTDFVNQNIIRSMGVIDVNNLIGSPRYVKGDTYSSIQKIQRDYEKYFSKTVNANEYIRFFKDITQGPSEMAEQFVPAKTKLLDGIVIESPIIYRTKRKNNTKFLVDGTGTKKFERFTLGSGSKDIGAYSFENQVKKESLLPETLGDTTPIEVNIDTPDVAQFKSSTPFNKLPLFRRVSQSIGGKTSLRPDAQYNDWPISSIFDDNSSYVTIEVPKIEMRITNNVTSSGYVRNPFLGTRDVENTIVIPSENNTVIPFYDIAPRADLNDPGTVTYFHKSNGIYSYRIYTKYKTNYLVLLDTDSTSLLDRNYARVNLLSPTASAIYPKRKSVTIPTQGYNASSYTTGVITIDNIISLFAVTGTSGLRLRLYSTATDRDADITRPYTTLPGINSGVVFDGKLTDEYVFPYLLIQTSQSLLYYTINNETVNPITSNIVLSYFAYEPRVFIPNGYLPRHYRFSRDNGTALKRRNYLGCRDVDFTIDRTPTVQIFLSTANTITVDSDAVQTDFGVETVNVPDNITGIVIGGAGELNVG